MSEVKLVLGDCRERMKEIESGSVDAVICDPPYPHIKREYGYWTEGEWFELMRAVVAECRSILKPSGSAVFVLQPNYETPGRMRGWLWGFLAWAAKEWGVVQDAYWWNFNAIPTQGCQRRYGLLRSSVKTCVWLGPPDCFRDQDAVLWSEAEGSRANRLAGRMCREVRPRGRTGKGDREASLRSVSEKRGGTTPFNLIPVAGGGAPSHGRHHGAGTPEPLMAWWIRYLTPSGGVVCDPFMGSGTCGLAALKLGRSFVGIESYPAYFAVAESRIAAHRGSLPLFAGSVP